MIWRFNYLLVATAAILVFSCKKKESDQIKLQPDELVGAFVDTAFSINTFNVQRDSVLSGQGSIDKHVVGTIENDVFGQVNASFSTQIKIPDDGFDIESNAKLLTGDIVLSRNYYYGDDDDYSILIYQLSTDLIEELDGENNLYYTSDDVLLGDFLQEINLSTSSSIDVIPLNNQFLNKIRQLENQIANQTELNSIFKGINFQPSTGNGVLGFSPLDSKISLTYENTDNNGIKDTITRDFVFGDNIAHLNSFSYNRAGSAINDLTTNDLTPTNDLNNRMILQAGTRIEGLVSFETLNDKLFDTDQFIYKAELELKVDQLNYDKSGEDQQVLLEIKTELDTVIYTLLEEVDNGYLKYDVTTAIQEVISGEYQLGDIVLNASKFGHRAYTCWIENPNENIRLKIYFNK